jgi:thymidylate kinase
MNTPIVKLCPKLIIEGTRLTGKTDLAMALNEHRRIVGVRKYRYHSPIVSAEWNGFVKNPYGSSLIDFEEAYETYALRAYRLWLSLFELYQYYSWIVDRFHLSTQMWQAIYRGRKYEFQWLESRLSALGFRLIFCWRNPESFAEARAKRLQISSNPSQYNDLAIFIREQEILQQLVEDSAIPKLSVDVSYRSLEEQIDYIAGWLEATGGLNAVESLPNRKTPLLPDGKLFSARTR